MSYSHLPWRVLRIETTGDSSITRTGSATGETNFPRWVVTSGSAQAEAS